MNFVENNGFKHVTDLRGMMIDVIKMKLKIIRNNCLCNDYFSLPLIDPLYLNRKKTIGSYEYAAAYFGETANIVSALHS